MTTLSDKYGRKWFVVSTAIVQTFCFTAMLFSRSVWLTIAMNFVNGFIAPGGVVVGFIYICEFLPPEWLSFMTILYEISDSISILVATAYFDLISKHWKYIASVGLV